MTANSPSPLLKTLWFRRLIQVLFAGGLLLLLAMLYFGVQFNNLVANKFEGQMWQLPNVVYARHLVLSPTMQVNQKEVLRELEQLNYRKVAQPTKSGEYSISGQTIRLIRRPFIFPDGEQSALQASIRFNAKRVVKITDEATGYDLSVLQLEPKILGMLDGDNTEKRIYVSKDNMPETLVAALLATEDRDFYQHDGVSPVAIARAFAANVSAGRNVQGGSTLTQQLAKNLFLTRERSLVRKIKEAYLAVIMDYRYSKEQLLDAYLNQVYLGQNGQNAIHGFALASRHYFGRPLAELSLDQQALLVGLVKGPSYYNPWRYSDRAKTRRDLVLKMMVDTGDLEPSDYERAIQKPLSLAVQGKGSTTEPPYFDYIKLSLKENGIDYNSGRGLRLFTTFEPEVQRQAEAAVHNVMPQLEKKSGQSLETAMVIADKESGAVRAMIGSRHPNYHGFNRAINAERQIGSLIKPAVYVTALAQPNRYSLATNLTDKPLTIRTENNENWSPRNYDRQYRGQVTLYQSLAHSYNVPTVNLGMAVGLDKVTQTLVSLGVKKDQITQVPSMFLGALSLSPLEVTQMYQALGNDGVKQNLFALSAVLDEHGTVLYRQKAHQEKVLEPQAAWLIEYAMEQVVAQGTARFLHQIVPSRTHLAGKTGTSNQGRDSWYVGLDNRDVVTIWVGRDDNNPVALTGASGPLRIYGDYLKKAGYQSIDQTKPNQIGLATYSPDTNGGLRESCFGEISLPVWNEKGQQSPNCLKPLEDGLKEIGRGLAEAPKQIGGFLKSLFD